jgi:hypothetical protein
MVNYTIYQQSTVIAEQEVYKDYGKCLPVQITKSRKMTVQIPKKLLLLFEIEWNNCNLTMNRVTAAANVARAKIPKD